MIKNKFIPNVKVMAVVLVLLGVCTPITQARGVAALKEQEFHSNESAKLFIFEKVTFTGNIMRFDVKGRKPFTMVRSRRVEYVEILDQFIEDIQSEAQIAPYMKSFNDCSAFVMKYPNVEPLLREYIKILDAEIKQYDRGLVKFNGEWVLRKKFQSIKKKKLKAQAQLRENPKITIKVDGLVEKVIDGRIEGYEKLIVTSYSPDEIRFQHSTGGGTGGGTLSFEEIPEEVRKYLGLTEEGAKAYREKVAEIRKKKAHAAKKEKLLTENQIFLDATILQALGDGLLLKNIAYSDGKIYKYKKKVATGKRKIDGPNGLNPNKRVRYKTIYEEKWVEKIRFQHMEGNIFVKCDSVGFVDGGSYVGKVYPNGTFAYTNTLGARVTIAAYTTNEAEYLKNQGFRAFE